MNLGIAINLTSRRLEYARSQALRQPQHVNRTMNTGLGGLNRIMLVMNRRSRAGKVIDLVNLYVERKSDIVSHHFEIGIVHQMRDIAFSAGEEVINTQNVMPFGEQTLTEVGTKKAGSSGYQNSHITYLSSKI